MTKEKAINELTQLLHEDFLSEYSEALDMAIKAFEQQSTDAISRQAVLDGIEELKKIHFDRVVVLNKVRDRVLELSPVIPQPKMGHWIDIMVGDMPAQACDQCNTFYPLAYTGGGHKCCPSCGSRMVEPQESEG